MKLTTEEKLTLARLRQKQLAQENKDLRHKLCVYTGKYGAEVKRNQKQLKLWE